MAAAAPQDALETLLAQGLSLVMASVDASGHPQVSHIPFARFDGGFFVWVSDLAGHADPLRRSAPVEVMILAEESETRQVYARRRASWQCTVQAVADETRVAEGLAALKARHGEVVSLLAGLGDFRGFILTPSTGRLVLGFGQAYPLTGLAVTGGPIQGR
ncbi:MAG: pyridoxamine 5'-phosphate oxidase family protein [Halothiobacillaceae bacterium]